MRRRDFVAELLGSGAMAWSLAARAQQSGLPLVGYLSAGEPNERAPFTTAFQGGAWATGLVEGRNVTIVYAGPKLITTDCQRLSPIL